MIDKTKGPTGLVPIDPEHDLWAYQVDGLTVWAGSRAKCEFRYLLAGGDPLGGPIFEGVERAIRVLG